MTDQIEVKYKVLDNAKVVYNMAACVMHFDMEDLMWRKLNPKHINGELNGPGWLEFH